MHLDFWHERWARNEIGFHEGTPNEQLQRHFHKLQLAANSWVFVPMCGKTNDIGWLLEQGYRVKGAELNEGAVLELFAHLGLTPTLTEHGSLKRYSAAALEIYCGDIFALDQALLGHIDAVYDRAAIIALPDAMRQRYSQLLIDITEQAPQLLICYEFDKQKRQGPPFSVEHDELQTLYGGAYQFQRLERQILPSYLPDDVDATAVAWLLTASD